MAVREYFERHRKPVLAAGTLVAVAAIVGSFVSGTVKYIFAGAGNFLAKRPC